MIKIKQLRTFDAVLADCGQGNGCETCKPAVASILASLWNEDVLSAEHQTLQDTNDRFLANMQRGGSYSVVPRVPGGEITPDKLIVLGSVAKQYGLYTKITGGQRIDLFGAQVQDLPEIWEKLVDAGFESGHAYGKALRTVKSCVGTTWCRYGVQDSVGFAIRVENRYKGIRSPHKIKMAVSGCVRECAEAQSKDVGLIATENGYNLYVCGNGGSKPRHAELLAADLDEETAIKYVDRFLMYYISTADKLTRTSVWREKLEGGIEHIRDVVVHDKLGLAGELEAMIQRLIDTYQCEWAAVVRDPEKRRRFRQFANTDESETCIEIVSERGQQRPASWPSDFVSLEQFRSLNRCEPEKASDFLGSRGLDRGFSQGWRCRRSNMAACKSRYSISRVAASGMPARICARTKRPLCCRAASWGMPRGVPKVACPLHKKTFSLAIGRIVAAGGISHPHISRPCRGRRRLSRSAVHRGARPGTGDRDRLPPGDRVRVTRLQRTRYVQRRMRLSRLPVRSEGGMMSDVPATSESQLRPARRGVTNQYSSLIERLAGRAARTDRGRTVCSGLRPPTMLQQRSKRYQRLATGCAPGQGSAVRLRSRSRPLLGLQGVRHGLPQSQRTRRTRSLARRGAAGWRDDFAPRPAACHDGLSSLPRTGLPHRLPGERLRKGPAHRHRQTSRRSMLRLPVLHFGLSLRRAQVSCGQRYRPQMRHVLLATGSRAKRRPAFRLAPARPSRSELSASQM